MWDNDASGPAQESISFLLAGVDIFYCWLDLCSGLVTLGFGVCCRVLPPPFCFQGKASLFPRGGGRDEEGSLCWYGRRVFLLLFGARRGAGGWGKGVAAANVVFRVSIICLYLRAFDDVLPLCPCFDI